jgi:multiple antibiotic resistance protein
MDVGYSSFIRLVTLVLNPLVILPLFLGVTQEQTRQQRNATATKAICIATGLMLVVALSGESLFRSLGISFAAFRIAGGILLFRSAMSMVSPPPETEMEGSSSADVATFPLAIPIITGPGAMTYSIVLVEEAGGDYLKISAIVVGMLATFLLNWVCLRQSEYIVRLLGKSGLGIFQRICGVAVAALAVGLAASGVQETFFPHLMG